MPTKVGIRVYRMTVCRVQSRKPLPFDTEGAVSLPEFVRSFVEQNINSREATPEEAERDRRWYFEPRRKTLNDNKGVVRYGISGFESDLVDSKTHKRNSAVRLPTWKSSLCSTSFGFPLDLTMGSRLFSPSPPGRALS